jgi:hypothetical protein
MKERTVRCQRNKKNLFFHKSVLSLLAFLIKQNLFVFFSSLLFRSSFNNFKAKSSGVKVKKKLGKRKQNHSLFFPISKKRKYTLFLI